MKTHSGNVTKHQNLLHIILLLVLVFVMVLAVSCQSQAPAPAPAPPYLPDGTPLAPGEPKEPAMPTKIEVIIQGSTFIPSTQKIPAGAIVVWNNDDSIDHTVTARDNSFDSGMISPNAGFVYTFKEQGEVEYYCKIHPSMVGKITVE
jgi:plastocyanin